MRTAVHAVGVDMLASPACHARKPTMLPSRTARRAPESRHVLALLLGIAIVAPLLPGLATSAGMPGWLGGAVSLAALLGALSVFRHSAALRGWFLVLFIAALALAASMGWVSGDV